ncbi:MAG: Ig-like domain-containing protein [Christensenellaceae bacterium]|nr:Ig-like domain-containing protein [Christensenellaceae bacterium]
MKKRLLFSSILILAYMLVVISLTTTSWPKNVDGTQDFGTYTYARKLSIAGRNYEVLQSGESNFQYYHDEQGFMLIADSFGLSYAIINEKGKVVSSGVDLYASKNAINRVERVTRYDIDFALNAELLTELPLPDHSEGILENINNAEALTSSNPSSTLEIVNLVIFITFAGESSLKSELAALADSTVATRLNASDNSMRDYYSDITDGYIKLESKLPNSGSTVSYIYQDGKARSYYAVSGSNRASRESELLTNAVNTVKNRFGDLSDYDIDVDDDGNVDSVSFILSGADSAVHGALLWPHAWNLELVNNSLGNDVPQINGYDVAKYTFNFVSDFNYGVVCHEFGHVLGAPDFYHSTNDFVPVGDLDLMATNHTVPQYPLVYTRHKYFGGIADERIITVTSSGAYRLKPVTTSSTGDILAIKIPTGRAGEYFMAEYRNPSVSSPYDAMLSTTGLIVYRINEAATNGNLDAKYRDANNPDELYVFRPSVASGATYQKSRDDLVYAGLSPNNQYFTAVGKFSGASSYDYGALYFADGTNSGIRIETVDIDAESVGFIVRLNSSDIVEDGHFDGSVQIKEANYIDDTYFGVKVEVELDNIDFTTIAGIEVALKDDTGTILATNVAKMARLEDAYGSGERDFLVPFIVNDKGGIVYTVFSKGEFISTAAPVLAIVTIIDADRTRVVFQKSVQSRELSWDEIKSTNMQIYPTIYAGARTTAGIRFDGSVAIASEMSYGQWALADLSAKAVKLGIGLTHTLVVYENLKVEAVGTNYYGETLTSDWTDIIDVAAGQYTSYGLCSDGTVVAAGLNNKGQLETSEWQDIIAIAAGPRHVVGLRRDGSVVTAGETGDKLNTSEWSRIKAIAAGSNFTAGLTYDGRIVIAGVLVGSDTLKSLTGIEKIAAGTDFMYGLTYDGHVIAVGSNSWGQCSVSGLIDIIGVAAGERHGAFLRMDGTVVFAGIGNDAYNTNEDIENLLYDEYVNVTSVAFSITNCELQPGGSLSTTLNIYPTTATYMRVIYTSSNETVAVVDSTGRITAIAPGETVITAMSNQSGVIDTITVAVIVKITPTAMAFASDTYTVKAGESILLALSADPIGAYIIYTNLAWTISDPTKCEISSEGLLSAGDSAGIITVGFSYIDTSKNLNFTGTCSVLISTEILDIELVAAPSKLTYKYGTPLDLSGSQIRLTTSYGQTISNLSDIPTLSITGFDSSVLGTGKVVTVSYLGFSFQLTYNVIDYVEKVALSNMPKTQFIYGEEFSTQDGIVTVFFASGATHERSLKTSEVSGYNKYSIGISELVAQIAYGDGLYQIQYLIVVNDAVSSIDANILDTKYEFWENFKHPGIFFASMLSGAILDIPTSDAKITGFNSNVVGVCEVVLSYYDGITGITHKDSKDVTINLPTIEIELSGADENDVFRYVPNADNPYIVVTLLVNGTSMDLSRYEAQGLWYELLDYNSILSECTPQLVINVLSSKDERFEELERIQIKAKAILEFTGELIGNIGVYKYGESVDIKLRVIPTNPSYEQYIVTPTKEMMTYNPTLLGVEQSFVVSYIGRTYATQIKIVNYILDVTLDCPSLILYGDSISVTAIAQMAYGSDLDISQQIAYTANTIILGPQTVNFQYNGIYQGLENGGSFAITVVDAELLVEFSTTPPSIFLVPYGYDFETSIEFKITTRAGFTYIIEYTPERFSLSPQYNPHVLTLQKLALMYTPLNLYFPTISVQAQNFIAALSVDDISQTEYKYGAPLDIYVTGIYADGTQTVINPKKANTAGYTTNYNAQLIGTQQLIVTYVDSVRPKTLVTVTITVRVNNDPVSIVITKAPTKKDYHYGEALNFSGGTVEIVYLNGEKSTYYDTLVLSNLAIAYNPLIHGTQEVILTKAGKSVSYTVTVSQLESEYTLLNTQDSALRQSTVNMTIAISEDLTYLDLYNAFSTPVYLDLVLKTPDGQVIASTSYANNFVEIGSRMALVNKAGLVIREYRVWFAGDANLDGVFDYSDLSELAKHYLENSGNKAITDFDANETFTLTDLVNWAKKLAEKKQAAGQQTSASTLLPDVLIRRRSIIVYGE